MLCSNIILTFRLATNARLHQKIETQDEKPAPDCDQQKLQRKHTIFDLTVKRDSDKKKHAKYQLHHTTHEIDFMLKNVILNIE